MRVDWSRPTSSKPWLTLPTGLYLDAIEHLMMDSDISRSIGFILLDVSVETLLKTYLRLPPESTGAKGSHPQKVEAGSFRQLIDGVRVAAGVPLDPNLLDKVQYYHGVRNKLYHDGTGITVERASAEDYASVVGDLFQTLFGASVCGFARLQADTSLESMWKRVDELQSAISDEYSELKTVSRIAMECVKPKFLMPSLERRMDVIGRLFTTETPDRLLEAIKAFQSDLADGTQIAAPAYSFDLDSVADLPMVEQRSTLLHIDIWSPTLADGVLTMIVGEIDDPPILFPWLLSKIVGSVSQADLFLASRFGRDFLLVSKEDSVSDTDLQEYIAEGERLLGLVHILKGKIASRWCPEPSQNSKSQ